MELLRAIQRLLSDIRAWANEVQDGLQKHSEAEHDGQKVERSKNLPAQEVRAVVSLDDKTIRHFQTESEKPNSTQNSIKNATWGAVVAAGIYALISILIWFQMLCQNKLLSAQLRQSTESFRIDERGRIELDPPKTIDRGGGGPKFRHLFRFEIYPKNVGKTPVYGLTVAGVKQAPNGDISLGDNPDELRRYQDMMLKNVAQMPEQFVFRRIAKTVGPSVTSQEPIEFDASSPMVGKDGPYRYDFLIGRADYNDVFGISHWMTFCMYVADDSGKLEYCKEGNDEDKNYEIPPN